MHLPTTDAQDTRGPLAPLERMREIHLRLASGDTITKSGIALELGVDARTIQRDIARLKVSGAPVIYDRLAGGHRYTDTGWQMAPATLDQRDLFGLLLSEVAVARYEGTPVHAQLVEAMRRLTGLLPGELRRRHNGALRAIHFGGLPHPIVDPSIWSDLLAAVDERRSVQLTIARNGDASETQVAVHPYQLLARELNWFLVAHSPGRGDEELIPLTCVRAVEATSERFVPRHGFDARAYHSRGFQSAHGPGQVQAVALKLAPADAHLADELRWADREDIERCADGSVIVRFESAALPEVRQQVLRLEGRAEVLAPAMLRDEITEIAARILRRHESDPAKKNS